MIELQINETDITHGKSDLASLTEIVNQLHAELTSLSNLWEGDIPLADDFRCFRNGRFARCFFI